MPSETRNMKVHGELDVYQATKERMKFIIQNFDDFVVNFSGGKDSLVSVLMAHEAMEELGLKRPINVLFFDEEFVYPETLSTVQRVFQLPFVKPHYMTVQMDSEVLSPTGDLITIVFWDEKRKEYMRPKPEGSISDTNNVYDLYSAEFAVNNLIFNKPEHKGKKFCQILGLRAEESLTRQQRIFNSRHRGEYCYIHNSKVGNIKLAMPIYDWLIKDVFYYLKNQKVTEINEIYWKELLTKRNLRVDTPLHAKNRDSIHKIKEINPEFYQRIVEVLPGVDNAARYLRETKGKDYGATIEKYGCSLKGVMRYVDDIITDPVQRTNALKVIQHFSKAYIYNGMHDTYHWTRDEAIRILFKYSKSWVPKKVAK